jgi:hypothetical protein
MHNTSLPCDVFKLPINLHKLSPFWKSSSTWQRRRSWTKATRLRNWWLSCQLFYGLERSCRWPWLFWLSISNYSTPLYTNREGNLNGKRNLKQTPLSKGTVPRYISYLIFPHQSSPSGLIRGILWRFQIFTIFPGLFNHEGNSPV